MTFIPCEYASAIKQIVEWHLGVYEPEKMFNEHLNRVLDHYLEHNLVDGKVQIEDKELYYLYECISNATNNIPECGVDEDSVWEIFDWIKPLYFSSK